MKFYKNKKYLKKIYNTALRFKWYEMPPELVFDDDVKDFFKKIKTFSTLEDLQNYLINNQKRIYNKYPKVEKFGVMIWDEENFNTTDFYLSNLINILLKDIEKYFEKEEKIK